MRQAAANLDVCPRVMLRRAAVAWESRPASRSRPPGAVGSRAPLNSLPRLRPLNLIARAGAPQRPAAWLGKALRTASGGHGVEDALFGLVAFSAAAAVGILLLETTQFVFRWPAFVQLVSRLIG